LVVGGWWLVGGGWWVVGGGWSACVCGGGGERERERGRQGDSEGEGGTGERMPMFLPPSSTVCPPNPPRTTRPTNRVRWTCSGSQLRFGTGNIGIEKETIGRERVRWRSDERKERERERERAKEEKREEERDGLRERGFGSTGPGHSATFNLDIMK